MRLFVTMLLLSSAAVARSQERDVPQFDAVRISSGMHADITIGPQRPVHIEADEESLSRLVLEVKDGELKVRFEEGSWRHGMPDPQVKLTIQTPALRAVGASGGSTVTAQLTRADKSAIQASGGSEMHVSGVDAARLAVQASGGSILTVSGAADALDLQLSGGSQLHGRNLQVKDLEVQGSGGSQANLRATGTVRGGLSGGSELHARGAARADVSTSGGSQADID